MFTDIIHCIQYIWACISRASRHSTVSDAAQIIQVIADIRNLISSCFELCSNFFQLRQFIRNTLIELCNFELFGPLSHNSRRSPGDNDRSNPQLRKNVHNGIPIPNIKSFHHFALRTNVDTTVGQGAVHVHY